MTIAASIAQRRLVPVLTKERVYAAAVHAANMSAWLRGVDVWDDEACEAHCAEFDRLFALVGGPAGWTELRNR